MNLEKMVQFPFSFLNVDSQNANFYLEYLWGIMSPPEASSIHEKGTPIKFSLYSDFQFWPCLFFGIFWHFLRTSLSHWLSATKESLVGHKKFFFTICVTYSMFLLSHWFSATKKFEWNGNKCKKRRQSQNWKKNY